MRLQVILWPLLTAYWAWASYMGLNIPEWSSLIMVICGLIVGGGNFIEWLVLKAKR